MARCCASREPRFTQIEAFVYLALKRLHHPIVGDLELSYEVMELSADTGLTISVYSAETGSASQQALDLLGSWTATADAPDNPLSGKTAEH